MLCADMVEDAFIAGERAGAQLTKELLLDVK